MTGIDASGGWGFLYIYRFHQVPKRSNSLPETSEFPYWLCSKGSRIWRIQLIIHISTNSAFFFFFSHSEVYGFVKMFSERTDGILINDLLCFSFGVGHGAW
jgi:hypothetical protein